MVGDESAFPRAPTPLSHSARTWYFHSVQIASGPSAKWLFLGTSEHSPVLDFLKTSVVLSVTVE